VAGELDRTLGLLQDLQGPKVRAGNLPEGNVILTEGAMVTLQPVDGYTSQLGTLSIDYPHLAEEATAGTQVLLDDGLLGLRVESEEGRYAAVSLRRTDEIAQGREPA